MVEEEFPLVSICIPTYNGEKYIEEALISAINQTYSNLEIIVSDDNSTDKTLDIVNRYANLTSIPFFIYNHIPKGIGENWNNCVKKSHGKYIKFLFQDDILKKDCIQKMVKSALENKKICLVYCKRNIIYNPKSREHLKWISSCKILHESWFNLKIQQGFLSGRVYLKNQNILSEPLNKIGEPTAVLINIKCFNKIGYFDATLKQILDIEYWFRIMSFYDIGFVNEELVSFRLHENQATFINKKNDLNEMYILKAEIYKNVFWKLHFKIKWKLFKSQSIIGDFYRFLKKNGQY